VAVQVDDSEILAAMPVLARGSGVFAEPAGAAPLAGLQQLLGHIPGRPGEQLPKPAVQSTIEPDATVVLLVTGNGLKDIQSAMRASGTAPIIEPSLAAVKRELHL
jgi:threonine synthase